VRYVIRERFFHLGEDSEITDEAGQAVYIVDGKVFSLRGTLLVTDTSATEVARIDHKLIALVATYEISLAGGRSAVLRKVPFTPFHQRFTIDVNDGGQLEMAGDLLNHSFEIARGDAVVATVSKHWVSLTETYGVEVADGEDDVLILASVLALDLALDREQRR